jgi:uncharacterized low-complexity protein
MIKPLLIAVAAVATLALGACGEKPQTAGTTPKSDTKAWEGQASAHAADGYKGGDKAAWEQQLRQRAQNQNDYTRTSAKAP